MSPIFEKNIPVVKAESAFENQNVTFKMKTSHRFKCKCKKSNCQKLYCECFTNKEFCNDNCKCVDCENNLLQLRKKVKREQIESKIFCKCTKSNCRKNYCECRKAGKFCDSSCRCLSCENRNQNVIIPPASNASNSHSDNFCIENISVCIIKNKIKIIKKS